MRPRHKAAEYPAQRQAIDADIEGFNEAAA